MNTKENICFSCLFAFSNGKCNRLVSTCMGMRDRLGSDYKKDNKCPYYKKGDSDKREYKPMNFYNS